MDPRERMNNPSIAVDAMISGRLAQVWTAIPVKVVAFNAAVQTVQVQSMIIPGWNNPITGQKQIPYPMPIISDCPVMFPGGGGYHLTFPLVSGDEGLLILATRCIDGWWSTGKPTQPSDLRMHDLSDGFFIPGVRSKPNALPSVSTTGVQLRSDDGTSIIELFDDNQIEISTSTPGKNIDIQATGAGSTVAVFCTGRMSLNSTTGISLTGPGGSITANGNVLG